MQIKTLATTHIGRRQNNEDAHCVVPELGLYAVADGMGGYEGGEVASAMAVDTIRDFLERNATDHALTWPIGASSRRSFAENLVLSAITLAHRAILSHKDAHLREMGTTVAMMLRHRHHFVIGHVGDSRVYRLRGGELTQLTRDHSLYNQMMDSGVASLPPLDDYPFGHVITQALGIKNREVAPDLLLESARPGDTYLLCTDGLLESLTDDDIKASLTADEDCDTLVERAYTRGSKDNITAVIVKLAA